MKPVTQAAVGKVFLQPRGGASTRTPPLPGEQLRQLKVGTSTLHLALDTQPIHWHTPHRTLMVA